ncbi:uridine kinase family protein [Paenibacillus agricola]|uniref:Helicase superfamily 3 single-stranded DNA/RNA virus domain-containing protein n=1 Tax=Paenibacillus agricola TaxID=2716264 RepID=A0ABX0JEF0_9BACL|nr:hypothetical protein [Paenibacillus agricola]NHN33634.1 hypothetical protein [Paenibacillus agricola]
MENSDPTLISNTAVQTVASVIDQRTMSRISPLVVAIDGGSGAGKSMLAKAVAQLVGATVIHCDDFFSATITDAVWDTYSPEQKCRQCIDWQRMRKEVLEPLLVGKVTQYHPFSFESKDGLAPDWVRKEPAKVVILDGIYSTLPELSEMVHLTVLINVLPEVRRQRHNLREGNDDVAWHARWDPAEDYYFTVLRPPHVIRSSSRIIKSEFAKRHTPIRQASK